MASNMLEEVAFHEMGLDDRILKVSGCRHNIEQCKMHESETRRFGNGRHKQKLNIHVVCACRQ